MARIRTIKPEFPQSESVGRLSREARLLFLLLFTIVDDSGRTRAAVRMLSSLLYPYDEDACGQMEGWLAELESENHIQRYIIDKTHYLEINNWLKHQKISHPGPSRLPNPPETSGSLGNIPESSRVLATDLNLLNLGSSIKTLNAEEKKNECQRVKDVKKRGPPRHGAKSEDGKFVYLTRGTSEFEAYSADFTESQGSEPQTNPSEGRWFKWLGEQQKTRRA